MKTAIIYYSMSENTTNPSSSGGQSQSDKALSKLKMFLGLESFLAEFGLTDPKDKPEEKNDALVKDFCNALL